MNDLKCLSEQELSEFVQGRFDDARVEQIAQHLEACGDCQATVVMLAENSDTFVEQLRSPAAADPLEAENACRIAVERLAARAADGRSRPIATLPDIGELEQIGPYRIQGQLGIGGMGTVFEAVHTKLKRTVALKILPASRWTNPLAIARFEREMEIIGQLDHPNIVRASDAGEENGMHYLVMEHVDGLDLSRLVSRVGPLNIADACEIARQAAIGLQYASDNHLVHRDIKPSNLMLARRGQRSEVRSQESEPEATVKILDLGLALLSEAHSAHENELTTVGQLMGTLDYMSPEQGMDSHEVDIRADIYSLGATLFKLLTGRAPFASPQYDTLLKKVTALANKPVTPIKQLRDDIPDELAAIIDRMLAKEPSERFSAPNEVAAALEPFSRSADLGGLLTAALEANEPETRDLPPVLRSRQLPPKPSISPKAPEATNDTRWWKLVGLLMIVIFLALAAGIVMRIATDHGELIVHAEDDAQVVVRKDGVAVRQLEVARGDHAITVRSGQYRIELTGDSNELMISRANVIIKRGERIVVHVQQRPKAVGGTDMMEEMMDSGGATSMSDMSESGGMAEMGTMPATGGFGGGFGGGMGGGFGDSNTSPPKPLPTYDGKTYRQWLAELQTERKPERLTEAIRAFASLGEDDQELATQSAAVIMKIMRRNDAYGTDKTPQGKLYEQAHNVMLQMPGEVIVGAIEAELREGNTRSRAFSIRLLSNAVYGYGSPSADYVSAVDRHRNSLYELLLSLPDDESSDNRSQAISLVIDHAKSKDAELDQVNGLLPRLRATLKEKDLGLVAVGTEPLVELDPDNKGLVPALIRLLASNDFEQRVRATRSLGRLGTRSHAAVAPLIEILRPIVEPNASNAGEAAGYGGGFGGIGGGEGGGYGGSSMYGGGGMYGGGSGGYEGNHDIYGATIVALGNIGPAAKAALPVLRKFMTQETPKANPGGEGPAGAGMYGPGTMTGGLGLNYTNVAKAAIAKIEGKPVDHAAEPPELPDGIDLR